MLRRFYIAQQELVQNEETKSRQERGRVATVAKNRLGRPEDGTRFDRWLKIGKAVEPLTERFGMGIICLTPATIQDQE
jgi:hypothetical protein